MLGFLLCCEARCPHCSALPSAGAISALSLNAATLGRELANDRENTVMCVCGNCCALSPLRRTCARRTCMHRTCACFIGSRLTSQSARLFQRTHSHKHNDQLHPQHPITTAGKSVVIIFVPLQEQREPTSTPTPPLYLSTASPPPPSRLL